MEISKEKVAERIKECAKARKPRPLTPSDILKEILTKLRQSDPKANLTRQTVSNWWHGNNYPPNELYPLLADVLGTKPEYLLFGVRRGEQLRQERMFLSRISEEEGELLSRYREADKTGQKLILQTATEMARIHPAPEATVHPLRRKDDKI